MNIQTANTMLPSRISAYKSWKRIVVMRANFLKPTPSQDWKLQ